MRYYLKSISYLPYNQILIFEKTVLWKLFVEFDCLESARLALELNGTDLEGDQNLKMGVYESQL
jgi:hypothetical protein